MSGYKKVLAQVGSEVIDQCDERTGLSPAQVIADGVDIDTKITSFTGTLSVVGENSSGLATCYVDASQQIIALVGGSGLSDSKDNSSTLNVYVEGGSIRIQNKTGSEASVEARLH
jgi:hypothetical protein